MPFLAPLAPLVVGTAATAAIPATATAAAIPAAAATGGLLGTAGTFSLGQAALTTGFGLMALSQYRGGQAEQEWAEYNAKIAEQKAKEEEAVSEYEAERFRKAGEKLKAQQRAAYAKAGVTFEGTPMLVMEETAKELEIDILNIRRGGVIRKERALSEAALSRMKGKSAYRAGRIGAGATLLTGIGTIYR